VIRRSAEPQIKSQIKNNLSKASLASDINLQS